jgi:hypothetical protein
MTSSYPLETIDSVAASSPVITLYKVNHNRKHRLMNIGSTERYIPHGGVVVMLSHIQIYK